ncbi:uncharacterized protein LOC130674335 isoform X1 [Microplitis mediator]|uniref:uncharacterized protein LOC130674335 isoform X1 n=1 Tax=Microplitis mediator TaxID=375433 RepID=UPI0025536B63|nr:uncharacterized protein LOC130674335 isoform X1 [Microplitis mediator]
MSKGYALIYWIDSQNVETVKCSAIPQRCRKDGAVISLKWKNAVTGINERKTAKILKISIDKNELNKLTVDTSTGIVLEKKKSIQPNLISPRSDLLYGTKNATKIKIRKQKKQDNNKGPKAKHNFNAAVFTALSDNDSSSSESSSNDEDNDNNDEHDDRNENDPMAAEDLNQQVTDLLQSATVENVNFLKKLVGLMEKVCDKSVSVKREEHSVQDQHKADIHLSLGPYLPPMTINAIFHRNQDLKDWRKLSTDILVEIYGKELAFLSAKGRRGARGIDPNVYRAIYDLVNMRTEWIIPSKDFVRHVNKVCSNRKKYIRKSIAEVGVASTSQDGNISEEDPIATLEQGDFDHHEEIQYPHSNFCTIKIDETYSQAQM